MTKLITRALNDCQSEVDQTASLCSSSRDDSLWGESSCTSFRTSITDEKQFSPVVQPSLCSSSDSLQKSKCFSENPVECPLRSIPLECLFVVSPLPVEKAEERLTRWFYMLCIPSWCYCVALHLVKGFIALFRLPFRLASVFFMWILPLFIVWLLSCCLFLVVSCLIFFPLRWYILSSLATQYPISFKPKVTSLMLTKPYIDLSFAPVLTFYGDFPSSGEIFNQHPEYLSSVDLDQVDRQVLQQKRFSWDHPLTRYYDLMDTSTMKTNVLLGFFSFFNTSWEIFDEQGLTLEERCLYYHRARHFGYKKEALSILQDSYWMKLFSLHKEKQYRSIDNSGYVDVVLKFHLSDIFARVVGSFEMDRNNRSDQKSSYGHQGFRHSFPLFNWRKKSETVMNKIHLTITLELFDTNCSLIVRSFKPFTVYKRNKPSEFLVYACSLVLPKSWNTFCGSVAEIPLIERFPSRSLFSFYMGRVSIAPHPHTPDFSANIVILHQFLNKRFHDWLKRHPFICFVVFCSCLTFFGSFVCLVCCGTAYTWLFHKCQIKMKQS